MGTGKAEMCAKVQTRDINFPIRTSTSVSLKLKVRDKHFSLGFSLLQSPFSSTRPLSGPQALQTLHSLSTEAIGTPEGALYFHLS